MKHYPLEGYYQNSTMYLMDDYGNAIRIQDHMWPMIAHYLYSN